MKCSGNVKLTCERYLHTGVYLPEYKLQFIHVTTWLHSSCLVFTLVEMGGLMTSPIDTFWKRLNCFAWNGMQGYGPFLEDERAGIQNGVRVEGLPSGTMEMGGNTWTYQVLSSCKSPYWSSLEPPWKTSLHDIRLCVESHLILLTTLEDFVMKQLWWGLCCVQVGLQGESRQIYTVNGSYSTPWVNVSQFSDHNFLTWMKVRHLQTEFISCQC
jgi:hypothetical protein